MWDVTSVAAQIYMTTGISTHTSRVGCDWVYGDAWVSGNAFLLTHPVWDVTCWVRIYLQARQDFYSHIPCGM